VPRPPDGSPTTGSGAATAVPVDECCKKDVTTCNSPAINIPFATHASNSSLNSEPRRRGLLVEAEAEVNDSNDCVKLSGTEHQQLMLQAEQAEGR